MGKCVCSNCGKKGKNFAACSACGATRYCSKSCQIEHWKQGGHNKLCKRVKRGEVNAGDAQQLKHKDHRKASIMQEVARSTMGENAADFQKAFQIFNSKDTSESSVQAIQRLLGGFPSILKMTLVTQSLNILTQAPTEMLKWQTSPLLILLNMPDVNPSETFTSQIERMEMTALHFLARMASGDSFESHDNQTILARQLIQAGADVNARATSDMDPNTSGMTPLSFACNSQTVTNLDFIRLLLKKGADPNIASEAGVTPLMGTICFAMAAAKCLLNYPEPVVPLNIDQKSNNGSTFLGMLRHHIGLVGRDLLNGTFAEEARPARQALLKQMLEVSQLAVEKGAVDDEYHELTRNTEPNPNVLLPYDVGVLLDIDDLRIRGPSWYKENLFFINDVNAQQTELFSQKPYLHSGFTRSGEISFAKTKAPAVGQLLELAAPLPPAPAELNGEIPQRSDFALLSGKVTEVFPPPKEKRLRGLGSTLYNKKGKHFTDVIRKVKGYTDNGTYEELLSCYGFVHGQRVKGIVSHHTNQILDAKYRTFFRGHGKEYEVVLECNDHQQNQWQVVSIRAT